MLYVPWHYKKMHHQSKHSIEERFLRIFSWKRNSSMVERLKLKSENKSAPIGMRNERRNGTACLIHGLTARCLYNSRKRHWTNRLTRLWKIISINQCYVCEASLYTPTGDLNFKSIFGIFARSGVPIRAKRKLGFLSVVTIEWFGDRTWASSSCRKG